MFICLFTTFETYCLGIFHTELEAYERGLTYSQQHLPLYYNKLLNDYELMHKKYKSEDYKQWKHYDIPFTVVEVINNDFDFTSWDWWDMHNLYVTLKLIQNNTFQVIEHDPPDAVDNRLYHGYLW